MADRSARKSERLMNLTIRLLVAHSFVTKDDIRHTVEDYRGLSDDAFHRKFDRDKEELRALGVPIETGYAHLAFEDEPGYRIRRSDYELPEISFDTDEIAVLGLAARVWRGATLEGASAAALRKLRAGGVDVDERALDVLEPRLAGSEPAFDRVFEATTRRIPIAFAHTPAGVSEAKTRHLQPWGIVSHRGHWYVLGHDRDRDAKRMFRLSRISGDVRFDGEPGGYDLPDDLDLRAEVRALAPPAEDRTAVVRARRGRARLLRRRASDVRPHDDTWDELDVPYASPTTLAEDLCGFGPDVVAVSPDEVRDQVVLRLTATAEAGA